MNVKEFAACLESRIYIADINYDTIRCLCYDAREWGFASVQVWPNMMHLCDPILKGSNIKIAALNSWSYSGFTSEQMAFEAANSVEHGAGIVEAMINLSWLKSGMIEQVEKDVQAVRCALPNSILKFVVQVEYLNEKELKGVCEILVRNNVDYIITSTGYYVKLDENRQDVPILATVDDVKMIRAFTGTDIKIQAQGNILEVDHALKLLEAGADIVGTRCAVKICEDYKKRRNEVNAGV